MEKKFSSLLFDNLTDKEYEDLRKMKRKRKISQYKIIITSDRCDYDKIKWLKKYLPELKLKNIIIMRNGQNKHDFIKTKTGILLDDYGKNCREWEEHKGCIAIKVNGVIKL